MSGVRHIIMAVSAMMLCISSSETGRASSGLLPVSGRGAPELEILDSFVASVNASRVSFGYEYTIDDGRTEIRGSGFVEMQGDSYRADGNGLEVFCNGKYRWTVDRESREVVIESYDPEHPDYAVNPAALLKYFGQAFEVRNFSRPDQSSVEYLLEPVSKDMDMTDFIIRISADGKSLVSASFSTGPGTSAEFSVSSFSFSPKREDADSFFSFDVSDLDDSYIVTDLR